MLTDVFDDRIAVDLKRGSMHLIVRWACGVGDIELTRKAQDAGLATEALSTRAIKHTCGNGLFVVFTNLVEKDAVTLRPPRTCNRTRLTPGRR